MRVGILLPLNESFEPSLSRVTSLGFESGQISVWDMSLYTQENAERVKALCARHRFEITAVWCGWSGPVVWKYPRMYSTLGLVPDWLRAQRMNDILRGAAFARMLGVRDIVTHLGYIPDDPFSEKLIAIAEALSCIAAELLPHGQRLLFETGEELPVTLVQLIERVGSGNLGVNLDPANLLSSGRANPADAVEQLLAPYVWGMHAKDATYPTGTSPKGHETRVGEGHADFRRILAALSRAGYCGDITIERETDMDAVWEKDIVDARAYLTSLKEEMAI